MVERCRLRSFGNHSAKDYGEGSFAEAKLRRLGNILLIARNPEGGSEPHEPRHAENSVHDVAGDPPSGVELCPRKSEDASISGRWFRKASCLWLRFSLPPTKFRSTEGSSLYSQCCLVVPN